MKLAIVSVMVMSFGLVGCNANTDAAITQTGKVISIATCTKTQCEALVAVNGGDWEYSIVDAAVTTNTVVSRTCVEEEGYQRCSPVWVSTGKKVASEVMLHRNIEATKPETIIINSGNPNHATSRNQKHHDFMVQVANDANFAAKYHVEQRIARDYLAADAAAGLYQN